MYDLTYIDVRRIANVVVLCQIQIVQIVAQRDAKQVITGLDDVGRAIARRGLLRRRPRNNQLLTNLDLARIRDTIRTTYRLHARAIVLRNTKQGLATLDYVDRLPRWARLIC